MKRIQHPGLFIKTYTPTDIEGLKLTIHQADDISYQLLHRYFADEQSFTPTEQEKKWGILEIQPASSYWYNFRRKMDGVVNELLENSKSNRAVITIDYPDAPPCFQSFQFKINSSGGLEVTAFARSLDLENGLPVDATIFWTVLVISLCKLMELNYTASTLTIISVGAHTYED